MNEIEWEKLENDISSAIDSKNPKLMKAISDAQNYPLRDVGEFIGEKLSNLISPTLEQSSIFDGGGILVSMGNGNTGFTPEFASQKLIELSVKTGSSAYAIRWLKKVLLSERAKAIFVYCLWGIDVEECCQLSEDISVVPFHELPPSIHLTEIESRSSIGTVAQLGQQGLFGKLKAALIVPFEIKPFIWYCRHGRPPEMRQAVVIKDQLDEIINCLTLVGPGVIAPAYYWVQLDDPEIEEAVQMRGRFFSGFEIDPGLFGDTPKFNGTEATWIVERFGRLSASDRVRFNLSANRLNQAMRRRDPGDRAMELAIALESVLVSGRGENTFKVSLRSALLFAPNIEERKRARAIVKSTYALRSAVVHSGRSPDQLVVSGFGRERSREIVAECTDICAVVLKEILARGAIPDWDELEL